MAVVVVMVILVMMLMGVGKDGDDVIGMRVYGGGIVVVGMIIISLSLWC